MKIKVIGKMRLLDVGDELEFAPGYVFTCDPACEDYDWLVVFDELMHGPVELKCPRERTILATWEPINVKTYLREYVLQFGHYLTNRPESAERHPHYHFGRGYFPWCLVRKYPAVAESPVAEKIETISAVCSAKQMKHTKHGSRFALLKYLQGRIPGLEWYGWGFRPLAQKEDALDHYRYHIAVENHIAPGHWSEKLPDAILCECLPFYAGDPELDRILPAESFIRIPIDDPPEAERIIRAAIAEDAWTKRLSAIREAKRLLLTKYNFWAQVIEVIKAADGQSLTPVDPARPVRLLPRRTVRLRHPLAALADAFRRLKINMGYDSGQNG